jgi:hypothetical protein
MMSSSERSSPTYPITSLRGRSAPLVAVEEQATDATKIAERSTARLTPDE